MGVALMSGNNIYHRLIMKVDVSWTFKHLLSESITKSTVVLTNEGFEGDPQVYVGSDQNYNIHNFDLIDWDLTVKDMKDLNAGYRYVVYMYALKRKVDLTKCEEENPKKN